MRAAGGSDEGRADAPSFARAHRDVLQIGITRRQAAGDRYRLRVTGMHASALGIEHFRQLVGIGALELGQLSRFEQDLRQRVVECQLREHFFVSRRRPGRRFLLHRQTERAEEDFGQLLRRVDIERLPGRRVCLRFELEQALADLGTLFAEQLRIDQHAGPLHAQQDLAHRHLDRLVDPQPDPHRP
jgi:hypothetical protein